MAMFLMVQNISKKSWKMVIQGPYTSTVHVYQVIFKSGLLLNFEIFILSFQIIHPYPLTEWNRDQNNLNNLGIGSPKDHMCQIIFKSGQ